MIFRFQKVIYFLLKKFFLIFLQDKLKTFVTNQNIEEGAIKQIEKGHKDDIIKLQSSLREGFNTEAQVC